MFRLNGFRLYVFRFHVLFGQIASCQITGRAVRPKDFNLQKFGRTNNYGEIYLVENVICTKHNLLFSRKIRLAKNNIRPELSFGRTHHLAEMDEQPAKMILC